MYTKLKFRFNTPSCFPSSLSCHPLALLLDVYTTRALLKQSKGPSVCLSRVGWPWASQGKCCKATSFYSYKKKVVRLALAQLSHGQARAKVASGRSWSWQWLCLSSTTLVGPRPSLARPTKRCHLLFLLRLVLIII